MFKNRKGITLVALVITIIILLILAGVSIATLTDSGLFEKTKETKAKSDNAQKLENETLSDYEDKINEYITGTGYTDKDDENNENNVKADGSWDVKQKVNEPQLMEGMTGVYWDSNGNEVTVTQENQENWYDYENQKWANATTKDGSYWVWIPRYAYKITSNCYTSTAGTIEIKFLQGTSNKDSDGKEVKTTYPSVENNAMQDFVLHPAFGVDVNNGGWSSNLAGIWIAKYAAGFQECTQTVSDSGTITNPKTNIENVKYSEEYYKSYNSNYTTNALSQDLSSTGYSSQKISYPVFKPLTYAYNCISIGDSFTISLEIAKASNFYGLSSSKTDSHMMKNSEWGAVAYLAQSKCGRNGAKVTINSKNLSNLNSKNIYAVTGYAENTANGVSASTTNNMSGVFDMSGCVWERTAGLISNGDLNLLTYGKSILDQTNIEYTTSSVTENTGNSTRYVTLYPYNSSSDNSTNNYEQLKLNKTTRFGDSVLETSIGGNIYAGSWNSKFSDFPNYINSFFVRGGICTNVTSAGLFAFGVTGGYSGDVSGFRAALVCF